MATTSTPASARKSRSLVCGMRWRDVGMTLERDGSWQIAFWASLLVLIAADERPNALAGCAEAALTKPLGDVVLHGLKKGNCECRSLHELYKLALFMNRCDYANKNGAECTTVSPDAQIRTGEGPATHGHPPPLRIDYKLLGRCAA